MPDATPRRLLPIAILSLLGGSVLFLAFAIFVQYRVQSQGLAL